MAIGWKRLGLRGALLLVSLHSLFPQAHPDGRVAESLLIAANATAAGIYELTPHEVTSIAPVRGTEQLRVVGDIQPFQRVTLRAKTEGRIVTLSAREGDTVRAGDTLVWFETSDLETEFRQGASYVSMLGDILEEEMAASLPPAAVAMFKVMLDLMADLDERIADLDREVERRARENEKARRLTTIPGIGPIAATALTALAPAAETFAKGRDFAAWLGLTPLQHSTGGKQKLGATSKMGERTLRRLLIIGASAVIKQIVRRGPVKGSWLEQMLAHKQRAIYQIQLTLR